MTPALLAAFMAESLAFALAAEAAAFTPGASGTTLAAIAITTFAPAFLTAAEPRALLAIAGIASAPAGIARAVIRIAAAAGHAPIIFTAKSLVAIGSFAELASLAPVPALAAAAALHAGESRFFVALATVSARSCEPAFFLAPPVSAAPKMLVALHHVSPFLTNPSLSQKNVGWFLSFLTSFSWTFAVRCLLRCICAIA
jgi:hypothetical protein